MVEFLWLHVGRNNAKVRCMAIARFAEELASIPKISKKRHKEMEWFIAIYLMLNSSGLRINVAVSSKLAAHRLNIRTLKSDLGHRLPLQNTVIVLELLITPRTKNMLAKKTESCLHRSVWLVVSQ